jgi:hypothetical protein
VSTQHLFKAEAEAWRQVIQVPASNDYSKSQAARRQIPGILAGDNFFCYGGLKEAGLFCFLTLVVCFCFRPVPASLHFAPPPSMIFCGVEK